MPRPPRVRSRGILPGRRKRVRHVVLSEALHQFRLDTGPDEIALFIAAPDLLKAWRGTLEAVDFGDALDHSLAWPAGVETELDNQMQAVRDPLGHVLRAEVVLGLSRIQRERRQCLTWS